MYTMSLTWLTGKTEFNVGQIFLCFSEHAQPYSVLSYPCQLYFCYNVFATCNIYIASVHNK